MVGHQDLSQYFSAEANYVALVMAFGSLAVIGCWAVGRLPSTPSRLALPGGTLVLARSWVVSGCIDSGLTQSTFLEG